MFVYCRVTTQDARGDEKLAEKLQDLAGVVTCAAMGRQPDFSPHGDARCCQGRALRPWSVASHSPSPTAARCVSSPSTL